MQEENKPITSIISGRVKKRISSANPEHTVVLFNGDKGINALEVKLGVLSTNEDEMFLFCAENDKLYHDLYVVYLSDDTITYNSSISLDTYKEIVRNLSGNRTDDKMFESTIPNSTNGVIVLEKSELEEYTNRIFQYVRSHKNQITGEVHKLIYENEQWLKYNPNIVNRNRFLQIDMDAMLDKINEVGGFNNLDIFTKKLLKVYNSDN